MTRRNAFYAQSGGVTAVINASAAGVIETARLHRDRIGKVYAGRNGIIGALTEDLIDTGRETRARDRRAEAHAGGRVRLVPVQAQGPRGESGAVRAAHRGVPRARHRLLLLQRRQRLGRHLPQGVADLGASGLSAHRRPRAEDRRQRSRRDRQLPRFRLGREVRGDVDARSGVRRRVDGEDVDQGVRARGDGSARRLDHGRGGDGRRSGDAHSVAAAVPGDRLRRGEVPRRRSMPGCSVSATAASACRKD